MKRVLESEDMVGEEKSIRTDLVHFNMFEHASGLFLCGRGR